MIQANKDFGPRKLEWRQKELLSDYFWQYTPTKPEEVSSLSWNAQFFFEQHDCAKFRMVPVERQRTKPQKLVLPRD